MRAAPTSLDEPLPSDLRVPGFRFAGVHAGIKKHPDRFDLALLFILLFGILLRCQYLDLPMAEAHRWREITNADIARNFAERSMNIFYPQVNWGGAHDPYVGMEFPLMHWIAALFYLGRVIGELRQKDVL